MDFNFDITPAEWRLMRVIWTQGETTSTALTKTMTEEVKWKSATVKTLLRRLVKKGALSTTKKGRAFVYRPLVDEQKMMDKAADDLFNDFCQHRVGQVLTHVVAEKQLSKDDIHKLQQILASKEKDAPDVVPCDCLPGKCYCHNTGNQNAEKNTLS